jgi:hypothetical protein
MSANSEFSPSKSFRSNHKRDYSQFFPVMDVGTQVPEFREVFCSINVFALAWLLTLLPKTG